MTAAAPARGRIAATLARLKEQGSLALIGWQTVGYPEPGAAERLVPVLLEGGFDMVELGVPFSDPMADGPTIQRASQRALENGISLADCFAAVRALRRGGVDAPLLFMTYYNPVLSMGLDRFAGEAADAGLDGLIVADLPAEESDELVRALEPAGVDAIFLVAPTSTEERLRAVAVRARRSPRRCRRTWAACGAPRAGRWRPASASPARSTSPPCGATPTRRSWRARSST